MAFVFDERKLLPAGVHEVSLEVVEGDFAKFQTSGRRIELFEKLRSYFKAIKRAGCADSIIVDGSFVMPCIDQPEDIDPILVLPPNWDMAADLKPYQYNLLSKKRVRQEYGIDVIVVRAGSVEERKWVAFFSKVNIK